MTADHVRTEEILGGHFQCRALSWSEESGMTSLLFNQISCIGSGSVASSVQQVEDKGPAQRITRTEPTWGVTGVLGYHN
jgi:hypothetical protein